MNASTYLLGNSRPEQVAFVHHGTHTYADLRALAAHIGKALEALSLPVGARVAITGPNSTFWVAAYLAILDLGLVAVPFPMNFKPDEIRSCAQWAGVRAVVSEKRGADLGLSAVITRATLASITDAPAPETRSVDSDSDALLLFTSGSTGRPRAVRITHANIRANTDSIINYIGLAEDDRMLVVLPFTYSFGLSLLHTHLRVGGSLVLLDSFAYPERALDIMQQEACTGLAGVPSTFALLLRNSSFARRDFPHLRHIQQAGGKLPAPLVKELVEASGPARVYLMYGQTEATARLSYLPPDDIPTKPDSIGRGIPGVKLAVLGEDHNPVAPGEVGEIYAAGGNISPGYLGDPEATAQRFADGWLRTGDLATVDEDGYVYIVDRAADFMKPWGYRVSSQEVEAAALALPAVVNAAAIGVPDVEAGERIVLFVVSSADVQVTTEDVILECKRRLARHKVPAAVHLLDSLPLNANGKIAKSVLREFAATPSRSGGSKGIEPLTEVRQT